MIFKKILHLALPTRYIIPNVAPYALDDNKKSDLGFQVKKSRGRQSTWDHLTAAKERSRWKFIIGQNRFIHKDQSIGAKGIKKRRSDFLKSGSFHLLLGRGRQQRAHTTLQISNRPIWKNISKIFRKFSKNCQVFKWLYFLKKVFVLSLAPHVSAFSASVDPSQVQKSD